MTSDLHMNMASSALDEETARAEIYGLLSTLYYQAPEPGLLAQLRVAVTQAPMEGAYLEAPWAEVVSRTREMSDEAIAQEFNVLFAGVGKPEVYLFGSHYLSGFLNEKPLVRLRDDLAELGLAAHADMRETEDHVSYLFEVMRYLIAGQDVAVSNLTRQKDFFSMHLQPWVAACCESMAAHPRAHFYRSLAAFTSAFAQVEAQGFDLLS